MNYLANDIITAIKISIDIQVPDYFYCHKFNGKWDFMGDRYCDKLRIVNINFTKNAVKPLASAMGI